MLGPPHLESDISSKRFSSSLNTRSTLETNTKNNPPILRLYLFVMSPSVVTSVEWISANQVQYPNITVCHPKYFDIEKIKGLNLNPAVVAQGLKQQQQCLNTVATYCWWFESHLRHLKSYHFWEKILLGL